MIDLPEVIPIFPLPSVVLFPGVPLPLHIFEPRYREMVRDVNERHPPLIGMTLLRGEWKKDYYGAPPVFSVGCAGRVVAFEPVEDGRSNIVLQGVREFVVEEEVGCRAYREARVRWLVSSGPAVLGTAVRERLRHRLARSLELGPGGPGAELLKDELISDELLVNFFCYALDVSPLEKQALLEATSLGERALRLCEVVEFALNAGGALARPEGEELCH